MAFYQKLWTEHYNLVGEPVHIGWEGNWEDLLCLLTGLRDANSLPHTGLHIVLKGILRNIEKVGYKAQSNPF